MKSGLLWRCLLALPLLVAACDEDAPAGPDAGVNVAVADAAVADAAVADAAVADAAVGASAADASADGGEAGAALPGGLAILSSDTTSTALSLATRDGTAVTKDQCFHSGSKPPGLTSVLSGDVVLPSAPQPGHEIALLDRKHGVITWLAGETCTPLRQMNVGPGFSANPYDLVGLPGGKGYVTRYGSNAGDPNQGSDILVIDTAAAMPTGRIDLRAHATATTPPAMPLLPMPTRAALVDGKVYVVLNNLSADFQSAGPGRVVVVDPATDAVTGTIDLPTLKNCGVISPATGADGAPAIVVGCSGPFSDGPKQIESAGVAWIDLGKSPPAVKVAAAMPFARPTSGFDVGVVDEGLAFTVVNGAFMMPPPDAVWQFGWNGSTPRKLIEAGTSYALSLFVDHASRRLYVLDADLASPRVHIFNLPSGAAPMLRASFIANPATGLPPRQMALY